MTSRDLLWGAAGAAVLWVVIERWRHRALTTAVAAGEVAPAIAVGEPGAVAGADDGPEADAGPCCAACSSSSSSSSSFWRGCDGAGDVILPGPVKPVVYPVIPIMVAPPVRDVHVWSDVVNGGKTVTPMHAPVRIASDHRGELPFALSRTGATISRTVSHR